jgi:uncharacterized protein YjbJ (UPF0337 family)
MEMTPDILQTKWPALKDKVQLHWAKFTDEDMTQLNGKREELLSALWLRYRFGRIEADMEITRWLSNAL